MASVDVASCLCSLCRVQVAPGATGTDTDHSQMQNHLKAAKERGGGKNLFLSRCLHLLKRLIVSSLVNLLISLSLKQLTLITSPSAT